MNQKLFLLPPNDSSLQWVALDIGRHVRRFTGDWLDTVIFPQTARYQNCLRSWNLSYDRKSY